MTRDLDKALKDYEPVFQRPTPVRYNVLQFGDDHRRMDALLRRHYDSFHPLVRDIFTSFTLEFSLLMEKVENMDAEVKQINDELDEKRKNLDDELDERVQRLRAENDTLKIQLDTKEGQIKKLEKEIKNLNIILKEKEALIVTQRRQLDIYIEKETKLIKEHQKQQETLYESIENVNEFTSELEKIEVEMRKLETSRIELEQENDLLKHKLSEIENQYVVEISEITDVYEELKSEFSGLLSKYEKLQSEKHHLAQELENSTSTDEIQDLVKQNEELQKKVRKLELEIQNRIEENLSLRGRVDNFRDLASKIMNMKQKLEVHERDQEIEIGGKQEQKKVVHPSLQVSKKRKWSKKKTPLELELEGKTIIDDDSEYGKYTIVENELNLDDSISRIGSKFAELDKGNEILSAMKNPIETEEKPNHDPNQLTNRLIDELTKFDYTSDVIQNVPETKNLQKVLEKLEGKGDELKTDFSTDFPKPPESTENGNETGHSSDNKKKKTPLKS